MAAQSKTTEQYSTLEWIRDDVTINAPELDHAIAAPELDSAVLAPQVNLRHCLLFAISG